MASGRRFCGPCKNALGEVKKGQILDREIRHHETISDCERAIEAGCLLCKRLRLAEIQTDQRTIRLTANLHGPLSSPVRSIFIYGIPVITAVGEQVDDDINGENGSDERYELGEFVLSPAANGKGAPLMAFAPKFHKLMNRNPDRLSVPGYTPTNTVGSAESMGLARFWIEECNKTPHCMQKTDGRLKSKLASYATYSY